MTGHNGTHQKHKGFKNGLGLDSKPQGLLPRGSVHDPDFSLGEVILLDKSSPEYQKWYGYNRDERYEGLEGKVGGTGALPDGFAELDVIYVKALRTDTVHAQGGYAPFGVLPPHIRSYTLLERRQRLRRAALVKRYEIETDFSQQNNIQRVTKKPEPGEDSVAMKIVHVFYKSKPAAPAAPQKNRWWVNMTEEELEQAHRDFTESMGKRTEAVQKLYRQTYIAGMFKLLHALAQNEKYLWTPYAEPVVVRKNIREITAGDGNCFGPLSRFTYESRYRQVPSAAVVRAVEEPKALASNKYGIKAFDPSLLSA